MENNSPVERKKGAVTYGGIAKEFANSGLAGVIGQDPQQAAPAVNSATPVSAPNEVGKMLSGIDRSGNDPVRAAAEDSIVSSFRDDMLFANLSRPAPKQDATPGALPHQLYYPNANDPIIKGYMSHPHLGNQPIFAASGGLMPVGMLDARRQVVAEAGKKQAARASEKKQEYKKIEAYKPVEQSINNSWWENMQQIEAEYVGRYGMNAREVLDDPSSEGAKKMAKIDQAHRTLGEYTTMVAGSIEEKMKGIVEGKQTATPETRATLETYHLGLQEAMSKINSRMSPDDMESVSKELGLYLSATMPALNMLSVYDDYFKSHISEDVKESYPSLYDAIQKKESGKDFDYNVLASETKKYLDSGRLDTFVDQVWRSHETDIRKANPLEKDADVLRNQVKEEIAARFGVERTVSYTTHAKNSGGGSGYLMSGDLFGLKETNAGAAKQMSYYERFNGRINRVLSLDPRKGNSAKRTVAFDNYAVFSGLEADQSVYQGESSIELDGMHVMQGTIDVNGKPRTGWFLSGSTNMTPVGDVLKTGNVRRQVMIPLTIEDKYGIRGSMALDKVIAAYKLPEAEMYQLVGASHNATQY